MTAALSTARAPVLTWRTLLRLSAIANVAILFAVAVALGDLEAGALAAAVLLGAVLLRFRERAAAIALGLLFADIAFFCAPAAVANLVDGAGPTAVTVPAALAAISFAGFVASVASIRSRSRPDAGGATARIVALGAVGVLAAVFVAALTVGGAERTPAQTAELRLEAKRAAFSSTALTTEARSITVRLANRDLFWHTFTIDALGVDLKVAVGAERQVTFAAPPGTYTYYCAVPGHTAAGMLGTLTVR